MHPPARTQLRFAEFTLDAVNAQLRRGAEVVSLRPKTLGVLCHLIDHAGQLVTKSDLMDAVWPDTAVGEWVLAGCIQELRAILGDDPRRPRFIETVHRRGYRFIAVVASAPSRMPEVARSCATLGRDAELVELDRWLAAALGAERQFGFIVGEAGIGKTSLLDAFVAAVLDQHPEVLVAKGQCIEGRRDDDTTAEPYLPVIEALARVCVTAAGEPLVPRLRRLAPSWLCLLPGVLDVDEARALQRGLLGTTPDRLALEMTTFLAGLPQPLVVILEDLHWSDTTTVELLKAVAQRRDPAKLLVLGTYRPADAAVRDHPMKLVHHSLRAGGLCRDLWLHPFDEPAVRAYLDVRCPDLAASEAAALARAILERTDGNPLFVRSVVDQLDADGALVPRDGVQLSTPELAARVRRVPPGLRQMIAAQIDRLDAHDREILEAGSLCGVGFSADAVSAVVAGDVVDVEARLESLARRGQMLRSIGEQPWPDGTVAGAYELTHTLFGDVLRDRIPPAMRRRGHGRIARRLAAAWRGRTDEIAAELASHFEAAGEIELAAPHVEEASARASRVGARREAVASVERVLAALEALPRSPDRILTTIRLYMRLGQALLAPRAEAERAFERARTLSDALGDPVQLFQATLALTSLYVAQARFEAAAETAEAVLELQARMPLAAFQFAGNVVVSMVRFHAGDLRQARALLEQALPLEDIPQSAAVLNFRVLALDYLAVTLLHLGLPDQARARAREAAALATEVGIPFDRASAAMFSCIVHLNLRDTANLIAPAAEAERLGTEYGFPLPGAVGVFSRGYVEVASGNRSAGVAIMEDGLAAHRHGGQTIMLARLLTMLADVHVAAGDVAAARPLVTEASAIVVATGERRAGIDLDRLRGDMCRLEGDDPAAERHLRHALTAARQDDARWYELRAALSLASLVDATNRRDEAAAVLSPLVASFDEGADLPDMRRARAALDDS